MQPCRLTLIGCGKMGTAMLQGWLAQNLITQADVIDPTPPAIFTKEKSITLHTALPTSKIIADIVILAVKPQMLDEAATALKIHLTPQTLILSIAAGKTLTALENLLGAEQPIIRTMPNTPAAIGKGMSVSIANAKVSTAQKTLADTLLQAAGQSSWITDESLMDAVTALSGSGPAYVFYLIEALAKAGEAVGLEKNMAMTLARQTVIGSAALAEDSADTDAATLRKNVTSPGGTTEAALNILMNGKFQDILNETLKAATTRGKALNKT